MKKNISLIIILVALCLQGCDDKDTGIGKGEIRHNKQTYQLYSAEKMTGTEINYDEGTIFYHHILKFRGAAGVGTNVTIQIRTENNKSEPGEFYVGHVDVTHLYDNSIQVRMHLSDTYILYPNTKKANLLITEKDDIFDIELKFSDDEDFLIKYKGLVEDLW
jgi:hypothetical protein